MDKREIQINTRDRLLRAWQNTMDLVRDFELYSQSIKDNPEAAGTFAEFAEVQGAQAARFRELLHKLQDEVRP